MIADIISWAGGIAGIIAALIGARHVLAQARQVRTETRHSEADSATEVMGRAMTRLDAEVARLDAERSADRDRIERLETAQRQARAEQQQLAGEVRPIVRWIDDGAMPPPPTIADAVRDWLHRH